MLQQSHPRSRQRARACPSELGRPNPASPKGASERARGTSYRRLQPTFFLCQRRAASYCVSCRYRFRYSEPKSLSLPDGVPRFTARTPRFGGSHRHANEHYPLVPHPWNRTSDAPSLHRPPRSLQTLLSGFVELASTAPPCSTRGLSRARTPSTFKLSPEPRERARTWVTRLDPYPTLRALFAHDFCRPLDGLVIPDACHVDDSSSARPRLPASAALLSRPAATSAVPLSLRPLRGSKRHAFPEKPSRAGRRHPRLRAFAPQCPEHRPRPHTRCHPRARHRRWGTSTTPASLGSKALLSLPPSAKSTPQMRTRYLPQPATEHGRSMSAPRHSRLGASSKEHCSSRKDPAPFLPLSIRMTLTGPSRESGSDDRRRV